MITTGYFQLFIFQYYRLTSKSDIYPRLHSLQSGNLLPSWNVSYKAPVLFMFGNLQLPLQYGIVKFQPRVYQDTSLDLELAQIKNLLEYRFHQRVSSQFRQEEQKTSQKNNLLKGLYGFTFLEPSRMRQYNLHQKWTNDACSTKK